MIITVYGMEQFFRLVILDTVFKFRVVLISFKFLVLTMRSYLTPTLVA